MEGSNYKECIECGTILADREEIITFAFEDMQHDVNSIVYYCYCCHKVREISF